MEACFYNMIVYIYNFKSVDWSDLPVKILIPLHQIAKYGF